MPVLPWVSRRGRKGNRRGETGGMDVDDELDAVTGWIAAAERITRADRCRHLDRLRHPRLPRPERRVDEEPGGREDGDDPALPRRPRRAEGGLAQPQRRTRRSGPGPTPATRRSSSWRGRASCTPSSRRTSTACTRRRASPTSSSSRSTARSGGRGAGTARTAARWPRRWPGSTPARRTRRARCAAASSRATPSRSARRSIPEVIDRADAGQRGVRPAARRRLDAGGVPRRLLRAAGQAGRRQGRHRQRRPTEMDGLADVVLRGEIGTILPETRRHDRDPVPLSATALGPTALRIDADTRPCR